MTAKIHRGEASKAVPGQPMLARLLVFALLLVLVLISALGVIWSSHENRQRYSELQQLKREALALDEQWGKLLLEQSTWASHERIRQVAEKQLDMVVPAPADIAVVSVPRSSL